MTPWLIVAVLLAFICVRECFFLYSVHKLLNKLMCRNYHEFQISEKAGKIESKAPTLKVDDDPTEDLGVLSGIGSL